MIRTYRMIVGIMVCIIGDAHTIIVLMGSRGSMHMALILEVGVLVRHLIVMALLLWLVHPWLGLGELLLVGENMLVLHLESEAECFRPTIQLLPADLGLG